jgi:hypothetical protein
MPRDRPQGMEPDHNVSSLGRGARQRRLPWWLTLARTVWFAHATMGQLIGTDICGCQPVNYTFTLDFGLACADSNVGGPGIKLARCLTELRGENRGPDEDLIPVTVSVVEIDELDQNLQILSQSGRTGEFVSGSNFTCTSIITTISGLSNSVSLPRGLQLLIHGENSKKQMIVQTNIIVYTNDCHVFPILTKGQKQGWTIFVSTGSLPWMRSARVGLSLLLVTHSF